MADLTDKQAAQSLKVVGTNAAGVEQTPIQSTSSNAVSVLNPTGTIQVGQNYSSTANFGTHGWGGVGPFPQTSLITHIRNIGTADGTGTIGIRSIKVTYLDDNMTGPYTETLAFAPAVGATPSSAAFVATNIRYVNYWEAATTGSSGILQNELNLSTSAGGGLVHTWYAATGGTPWRNFRYFIPVNRTVLIYGLKIAPPPSYSTVGGYIWIGFTPFIDSATNSAETIIYGPVSFKTNQGGTTVKFKTPIKVVGPGRIMGRTVSDSTSASTATQEVEFLFTEVNT